MNPTVVPAIDISGSARRIALLPGDPIVLVQVNPDLVVTARSIPKMLVLEGKPWSQAIARPSYVVIRRTEDGFDLVLCHPQLDSLKVGA
jgi:hypothetical protein